MRKDLLLTGSILGIVALAMPAARGDSLNIWNGGVVINSGNSTIKLGDNTGTPRTSLVVGSTTSGILQLSATTAMVELTGDWTELAGGKFNSTHATYPSNTGSTVTFNGNGLQTITTVAGNNFPNLTSQNSAATPGTGAMVRVVGNGQADDVTIKGNLKILDGQFGIDGAQAERVRIELQGAAIVGDTTTDAVNEEILYLGAAAGANLEGVLDVHAPTGAHTTLSLGMTAASVSAVVGDTTGYASSGYIVIGGEVMGYTSKTGASFDGLTRGLFYPDTTSSPAAAHNIGDWVFVPVVVAAGSADNTFNGGRVDLIGNSQSRAKIHRSAGTEYFNYFHGGTLNARWYLFANLADEGVTFGPRARILDLNNGLFQAAATLSAAAYMNLTRLDGGDRWNVVMSADGCQFDDPGDPDPTNVHAGGATPLLTFTNYSGGLASTKAVAVAHEWDQWDRISWGDLDTAAAGGNVVRYTSGGVFLARHNSIQAAVTAAAATNIIRPAWNMIHTESNVDLAGKNVTIERFVWAPTSGMAVTNSGAQAGTVRNCVIAKGDASNVAINNVSAVVNCTILPMAVGGTPLTITNVPAGAVTNVIRATAASSVAPDVNGNSYLEETAIRNSFYDRRSLDFHVTRAGTSAADTYVVDKGVASGAADDWEGHATVDIAAVAGTTRDVGADEYTLYGTTVTEAKIYKMNSDVAGTDFGARVNYTLGALGRPTPAFYSLVAAGGSVLANDYALVLWDAATGNVLQRLPLLGEPKFLTNFKVGSEWRIIIVLDTGSGNPGTAATDGMGDSVMVVRDTGGGAGSLSADTDYAAAADAAPWTSDKRRDVGVRWYGPGPIVRVTPMTPGTYTTTLTVAMAAGDGTATVASTAGFPTRGVLQIESEMVKYTGTTATTFTGLVRGAYSTAAAAHAIGKSTICSMRAVLFATGSSDGTRALYRVNPLFPGTNAAVASSTGVSWNEKTGFFTLKSGGWMYAGTLGASEIYKMLGDLTTQTAGDTGTSSRLDIGASAHPLSVALTELLISPYDNFVYRRMASNLGNPGAGWNISADVGAVNDGPLYPPVYLAQTWGCAAGRVYKLDLTDGSVADEASDWPVTFDGSVAQNLSWFFSKLMWGTSAGEMWMVTALGNNQTNANDGKSAVIAGFPFRAPGRKIVSQTLRVSAGVIFVDFATDWGTVYEFRLN